MNFDNIKKQMDAQHNDGEDVPTTIKGLGVTKMPIAKVRRSMKSEIITQLLVFIIFFAAPSFIEMHEFPKAVYYILMFITSLMTLGYLLKMGWFLKRTSNTTLQSKYVVLSFIYDLRLTLEVYKTGIIAGSLLLPLSFFAFYYGAVSKDETEFMSVISLDMPFETLASYALGYLFIAVFIYFITVVWADRLYGVHIKKLEKTLKEFDAD